MNTVTVRRLEQTQGSNVSARWDSGERDATWTMARAVGTSATTEERASATPVNPSASVMLTRQVGTVKGFD